MTTCLCARVRVNDATSATVRVNDPPAVTFGSSEYVPYVPVMDEYEGPYEVTPTEDTQTFVTQAKLMTADFIVAPIPTNYGRITYDGTTIHIS